MTDDLNDLYGGTSGRSAKFPEVGTTYQGRVVDLQRLQLKDFNEQLEVWDDGSPKLTWVLTVQTEAQDDQNDDGRRVVYCRSGLHTALKDGLVKAGKPAMADVLGRHCVVEFYGTAKPSNPRFNARKLYRVGFGPAVDGESAAGPGETMMPEGHVEHSMGGADEDIPF